METEVKETAVAKAEAAPDNPYWPEGAECLFGAGDVRAALDAQAQRIGEKLTDDRPLSIIALMKGGMYPAIELGRRLRRALRIDYVHATRYREATRGGEIEWQHWPEKPVLDGQVLLVDDIFDEGYTMAAVADRFRQQGLDQVSTAVLARKRHDRGLSRDWADDFALEVPDRYVFGCGMDHQGLWRQLDSIWALPA